MPGFHRSSSLRSNHLLERVLNLPSLEYTPPPKNPFTHGRVGRPRVFFPPSPTTGKRARSPPTLPMTPPNQRFANYPPPAQNSPEIPSYVPPIRRKHVEEAAQNSPGIPSYVPPTRRYYVEEGHSTSEEELDESASESESQDDEDSALSVEPATTVYQGPRIVTRIVGRKIYLKFIPPQPVISKVSAVRRPKPSMVDVVLGDTTPSVAKRFPNFKIGWLSVGPSGGQSTTYLAQIQAPTGPGRGPVVFAKVIRKSTRQEPDRQELRAYERLLNHRPEAEIGARSHFILPLEAFVESPKRYIFLFGLCVCDLAHAIRYPEPFMVAQLLQLWMAQVAAGLHHLHTIGIIHRDIKPENVLLDWQFNARLTDLGLAYISEHPQRLERNVKYAHQYTGTKGLMAPEVAKISKLVLDSARRRDFNELDRGLAYYGLESDYWGLGLLFYEMAAHHMEERMLCRGNMEKYFSLRKSCLRRGCFIPLMNFFALQGIEQDVGDIIYKLMDPNPKTRAGFEMLYAHEFFHDNESDRSLFDFLYQISIVRPKAEVNENRSEKKLKMTARPVSHMVGQSQMSWINPQTQAFQLTEAWVASSMSSASD